MAFFEDFARQRLQKDLPGFRKNGLRFFVHWISRQNEGWLEGMESSEHGFVPDGTRLRRQPAFNPACGPWDMTLELWEVEDTCPITREKLRAIRVFANDLFDLSEYFTELWVCDRYGLNRRKIYGVRDDIEGGDIPDAEPHEWWIDDTWVREKNV
jgi:hypothetical protein